MQRGSVAEWTVPGRVEEFVMSSVCLCAICVCVCVLVRLYTPVIAGNRPPSEAELTESF